jgi:hypothetical protein
MRYALQVKVLRGWQMTECNRVDGSQWPSAGASKSIFHSLLLVLFGPLLLVVFSFLSSWSDLFLVLLLIGFLLLLPWRLILLIRSIFEPWRFEWRRRCFAALVIFAALPLAFCGLRWWGDDAHLMFMLPVYMGEIHSQRETHASFDWGATGWAGQEGQRTLEYDSTDKLKGELGIQRIWCYPGDVGETCTSHLFGHFYLSDWSE